MSNKPRKIKEHMSSEVRALRKKIKDSDLSYRQIYHALHISKGWFMRMIVGDFIEPNPIWIDRINAYLDATLTLKDDFGLD